ncbi:MAG: hypothetical protein ACFE0J_11520, partial [Elainellaceae cyanobacterium]
PNSVVKRCSGENTLGVAPRENSSVPGLYSNSPHPLLKRMGAICCTTIYLFIYLFIDDGNRFFET